MKKEGLKKKENGITQKWTVKDALELYQIPQWGLGYYGINSRGHLTISPTRTKTDALDLKEFIEELVLRGIQPPILIRFTDIIKQRIEELNEAFDAAIREYDYKNRYTGVYPIKVNQHRDVVEAILKFGKPYDFGIEAGSKPELLVALAVHNNENALIVCNGYKDEEFVETALLASKLKKKVFLVVEKLTELRLILDISKRLNVQPRIGIRAKLSSRGRGKWESSGGDKSKFGLFVSELLEAVDLLRQEEMLDCFQLLHFHLGSQITAIQSVKEAMRESTRIFVELYRMGVPLQYFDVGGGLAVDYDGSKTNFPSSCNYTLFEYTSDIVSTLADACNEAKIPQPRIISESGRALVAHTSALIFNVLGCSGFEHFKIDLSVEENTHEILKEIIEVYHSISRKNFQEGYHDALHCRDEALSLFNFGYLNLSERGRVESIFWASCLKIMKIINELDYVPDELEGMDRFLADIYFCNFSVFRSMPDHWAIKQLFPVVPIHRMNERPVNRATLADITCDSDGKVDQFIDLRDVKDVIELHPLTDDPYYIGVFLIGAYQEILGDMHNLFGDTNTVHVSILGDGKYLIDKIIEGDSVMEVLGYIQYQKKDLLSLVRTSIETSLQEGQLTFQESAMLLKNFSQGLEGYTYLEND